MVPQGFHNLVAAGQQRIQRGKRLLEDHRQIFSFNLREFLLLHGQRIPAVKCNCAAGNASGLFRNEPHNGHGGHAFAAARFAYDSQYLAFIHVEGYSVHCLCRVIFTPEFRDQILHS